MKYFKKRFNRLFLPPDLVHELVQMQAELESSCLHVGLVPARDKAHEGHMVRKAYSRNCEWYRRFCSQHPSSIKRTAHKHNNTKIKRASTERTLHALIRNRKVVSDSYYVEWIVSEAKRRAERNPF